MNNLLKKSIHALILGVFLCASIPATATEEKPERLIEKAVDALLDQFTEDRAVFEKDQRKLFALVDRIVVPLFDFRRIAKLVMASHWKKANAEQRADFAEEFKKLLIGTYATALFQYTGNEGITFISSKITERKGRKSAKVKSQVVLSGDGKPIAVDYALILDKDEGWKIYNLVIGGLNMITSYRSTYDAAIDKLGIDGTIASMKTVNAKNF